ncbi:MAG: hypothetical protein ACUVUD_01850 [bacterium]
MRSIAILIAVLLTLTILPTTGCMKCGEKASEKVVEKMVKEASGGKVKADVGTVDISDLPQILRYPNAIARSKWQTNTKEGSGTVWTFESKDPKDKVVQFYKSALSTWKSSLTNETPNMTMLMFASQDEKEFVTITVASQEKVTSFNISYAKATK